MSNIDGKTLAACIILDIIDTVSDLSENGSETVLGSVSGVLNAGFDTADLLQVMAGLGIFMKLKVPTLTYIAAIIEPVVDEGIPIPLYTLTYLYSTYTGNDVQMNNKVGTRRAK